VHCKRDLNDDGTIERRHDGISKEKEKNSPLSSCYGAGVTHNLNYSSCAQKSSNAVYKHLTFTQYSNGCQINIAIINQIHLL